MTTTVNELSPRSEIVGEVGEPPSVARKARRKVSPKIVVGLVILGFFVLMAIVGPYVAPYNPSALGPHPLVGPSASHLLGTTQTGQDVLSQLLVGARSSMFVGFVAGAIATALSIVVGISAGYLGGFAEEGLSMLSNIFLVIPALPLLIVLTAFLPRANAFIIALVIAATGWAWGARVLRAQTLALRRQDYVEAARSVGERSWRIILFEILPNEAAIVASSFLFTVLFAILTDASLAFLGLGNITAWSWGSMLYWAENNEALTVGAFWWFIPPGLCIALVGTGLALANFGIDEFINPRLRAAGLSRRGMQIASRSHGLTPVMRRPMGSGGSSGAAPVRAAPETSGLPAPLSVHGFGDPSGSNQ
jgi:peptide/nickel transport system permease protein